MVLLVEIEDRKIVKPFLGGWRHKITSAEYLNAASQTGPPAHRMLERDRCSRTMQSVVMKDANIQPLRDRSTQMWRPDCFISSETDKYLTVKPYETYEEMQLRLNLDGNARIIQRNYRVYRLLKYIKESAMKYREILENCRKYEEQKLIMYRKRHQQEIIRKTYPQSRADFDMLYNLIERWRLDRLECSKLHLFKAARCAENYSVLEKFVEMLNVVDKKRQFLKGEFRKKKRVKFLTIHCKPIRWHGYKGKLVEMVTLKIQKARELKSIYDLLKDENVSEEERMQILISVKELLEKHNCVTAFDLLRLLDQELDLLARGVENSSLCHFRERIMYHYLCFVRATHECECMKCNKYKCRNLEGEIFREPAESRMKLCKSCLKLLPYYKFFVHGRMKQLSTCTSCAWLRERNITHVNYNPYVFLLNCVRADEKRKRCNSAIAFMMQKHDMYHLVNNIWHGYSVVSKNNDVFALRMIRYDTSSEWSPWNCILLTEEEAEIHRRIEDLETVYSRHLINQILLAHQIAKNHFKHLSTLDKDFRESSRYYKIQYRLDYEPAIKLDHYYFK